MILLKTIVGSLAANVNEITFTDNLIDGNSIIEVYYNSNDVYTVETWQREHTIGIVTSDHDFPVNVKVLINNVVAFGPYDDTEVFSQLNDLDGRMYHAEDAISGLTDRVGSAEDDIDALETGKQNKLTAGDNITIENDVISASGGISSISFGTAISEDVTGLNRSGATHTFEHTGIACIHGRTSGSAQGYIYFSCGGISYAMATTGSWDTSKTIPVNSGDVLTINLISNNHSIDAITVRPFSNS